MSYYDRECDHKLCKRQRKHGKTFYLKVEVSQNWIDDGFDMTEERCRQIAEELLPYAEGDEVVVRRIYRSSGGSK
jgi:hypothetical protein